MNLKFDIKDPTDKASSNYCHHIQDLDEKDKQPSAAQPTGSCITSSASFVRQLVNTPIPVYRANGNCVPEIGPLNSVLKASMLHTPFPKNSIVCCEACGTTYPILHIKFDFCSDGVVISEQRAKNKHTWPWFASLIYISPCVHQQHIRYYFPSNIAPVLFGFFHGQNKPKRIDEVFRPLLLEMILAKHFRVCTLEPRFFVGDGPGRAFFRSFPAANATQGCEG